MKGLIRFLLRVETGAIKRRAGPGWTDDYGRRRRLFFPISI
jgi:hypothetical protein